MIEPESDARSDREAKLSALIEVLHETERHVEELTAGEVDTVSNREGRTLMLRGSQDEMRHSASARQAAILDILPAHIALLDSQGVIVSVNQAWREFADANALRSPGHAVGCNYLEICERAQGAEANEADQADQADEAHEAAAGIRAVISGTSKGFTLEYPCDSETEKRWFLMTVAPTSDDHRRGAVVMHVNTTERRRAAEALQESERRFSVMLGNVDFVSMMLDRDGRITYCNERLLHLTGWKHAEVIGGSWFDLFLPAEINQEMKHTFAALLANLPESWHHENDILTRLGGRRLIRWNNSVLRAPSGHVIGTASLGEDITERREAEARIAYLNRIFAMLHGINTLIVRVSDRDELFRDACRIAVETGGFRMAMICTSDRGAFTIKPVASHGKDASLIAAITNILLSNDDASKTMLARAIRQKQVIVANDSLTDPRLLLGATYAQHGVRSVAILPLAVAGEVVGAIGLYASEIGFFHEGELKLLSDLAADISFAIDHLAKRERLDYVAYYDALTGLPNRTLFLERLTQRLNAAGPEKEPFAIFALDLERLKVINDAFGQGAGDEVLKQVSRRFQGEDGTSTRFARLGSDHFATVVTGVAGHDNLVRYAEQEVIRLSAQPIDVANHELRISARVGIAIYPLNGETAEDLLSNAQSAVVKARASNDPVAFHAGHVTARGGEKLALESRLRVAIEKEQFVLYYQPKVDTESQRVVGVEALLRWQSPELGLVAPIRFIPLLEETGLILTVGAWALTRAALDHRRWVDEKLAAPRIAVNVSQVQLRRRDFVEIVQEAIGTGGNPSGIDLEITESLIMEDAQNSISKLERLRRFGLRIALDDFGTGYSSLATLTKLPLDALKVDRAFIITMLDHPDSMSLVQTIITLAHSLRLKAIAEGVETEEQAKILRLLRCDEVQGFLFYKPMPFDGITRLLRE